jgi:hypothetical protein
MSHHLTSVPDRPLRQLETSPISSPRLLTAAAPDLAADRAVAVVYLALDTPFLPSYDLGMTGDADGTGSADGSELHGANDHAAWRTGRLSKARYSGRAGAGEQNNDPGWVEGILSERALTGLFDDPEDGRVE